MALPLNLSHAEWLDHALTLTEARLMRLREDTCDTYRSQNTMQAIEALEERRRQLIVELTCVKLGVPHWVSRREDE